MKLRYAEPTDAEPIAALHAASWQLTYASALSHAYLGNLHVSASNHRQGVGTALLSRVAQVCETNVPGSGLYLSVNQENQHAQRFYFELGATRRRAYGTRQMET